LTPFSKATIDMSSLYTKKTYFRLFSDLPCPPLSSLVSSDDRRFCVTPRL
jgi:hypothetical protein